MTYWLKGRWTKFPKGASTCRPINEAFYNEPEIFSLLPKIEPDDEVVCILLLIENLAD